MKNRKHQARSQACVLGMLALLRLFPILSTPPHTIIIAHVTLVVMTRNLSSVPTMYQALCQAPLYLILTTTLWSSTTICFIWKPGELKKKKNWLSEQSGLSDSIVPTSATLVHWLNAQPSYSAQLFSARLKNLHLPLHSHTPVLICPESPHN